MKKLFLLLCLSLSSVFAFSQWTSQISGTTNGLTSVYFTNSDTGYAVGIEKIILKTTNGGTDWTSQLSGIVADLLTSVYFTDADTGYAVGYYDNMSSGVIILKTTNGGTNWTSQSSGLDFYELHSVYFTDAYTGYVVGGTGTILKTINGGTNWTAQTSGTTNGLNSVYFTDADTGYAVGSSGTILKTSNGGTNWTAQTSGTTNFLSSVYFTDPNTGYVVGSSGTILKTNNGGVTFIEETGSLEPTFSIYPNPANDKITIAYDRKLPEETIISIFNIKGEKIMHDKFQNQNMIEMDVSMLAKGIYLVKIQTQAGIEVSKFVKK